MEGVGVGGVKINADNNFHLSLLHFNGGGVEEGVQGAPEDKQVDRIVCESNFLETPSLCTPQITISVSHFPFVSLWIEN